MFLRSIVLFYSSSCFKFYFSLVENIPITSRFMYEFRGILSLPFFVRLFLNEDSILLFSIFIIVLSCAEFEYTLKKSKFCMLRNTNYVAVCVFEMFVPKMKMYRAHLFSFFSVYIKMCDSHSK